MELPIRRQEGAAVIMAFVKRIYTVADIEALPEGERAELINGEMYMMASPTATHQELLVVLSVQIYNYIKSKKGACKVYPAPFAVYLHNDEFTYFEPDISVICDRDKLDEKGCHGAPDWVIEIASPSSHKHDYERKLAEYRKAGVREYWIVDAEEETITVFTFGEKETVHKYALTDKIKVGIYEDLEIQVDLE